MEGRKDMRHVSHKALQRQHQYQYEASKLLPFEAGCIMR